MIDSEAAIVAAGTMVPADATAAVAMQRTCEEQQMQLAGSARKKSQMCCRCRRIEQKIRRNWRQRRRLVPP